MIQYRSAAFFGRLYCPEALLGMMTQEELYDIETPRQTTVTSLSDRIKSVKSIPETTTIDGQRVNEEPKSNINPLHATPEWSKYQEACEIDQDISGCFPEPTTAEECLKAVEAINKAINEQNA